MNRRVGKWMLFLLVVIAGSAVIAIGVHLTGLPSNVCGLAGVALGFIAYTRILGEK